MKWNIVYEGAYLEDGQPYFPQKLGTEKLKELRQTQGPYKFANQYLNITIPDEDQDFKKSWLRYYTHLPDQVYTFIFIDPAISLMDGADYTATIVVRVDCMKNWYVTHAIRQRITATQTVEWLFKLYETFKPQRIGIEDVAYQKALEHFTVEKMLERDIMLPLVSLKRSVTTQDGKRSSNSKPMRIRSLIPRFEFGNILLGQGLDDLLLEYAQFPRGSHDDLLDALSSIEEIVYYPDKPKEVNHVQDPNHKNFEKHYIRQLAKRANDNQ